MNQEKLFLCEDFKNFFEKASPEAGKITALAG